MLLVSILTVSFANRFHLYYIIKNKYTSHIINKLPDDIQHKVWAHRVNSLEKAKEAAPVFQGIEIDVVFNNQSGVFDVTHPPAKSIHLDLQTLLSSLREYDLCYWLDVKNLNQKSQNRAVSRLIEIHDLLKINKNRIIVESIHRNILKEFSDAGFTTSYYLPPRLLEEFVANAASLGNKTRNKQLERFEKTIESGDFHYISCHSKYFPFIQKHLNVNKKVLLWNPKIEPHDFFARKQIIQTLQQDMRIEVLLVNFSSKFNR